MELSLHSCGRENALDACYLLAAGTSLHGFPGGSNEHGDSPFSLATSRPYTVSVTDTKGEDSSVVHA